MTNEVVQKMAASGSEAQEAKSQLAAKIAELDKVRYRPTVLGAVIDLWLI